METHLLTRLFVEATLGIGQSVTLDDKKSHYLQHVMRMKTGEPLRLFNGRDGEWLCVIDAIAKKSITLKCREQLREQKSEPDLWLCCAPIKKAHFDYMIEKATELGVGVIQPLLTSRTQIREVNTERARAIAIEAAEQSERLNIPEIRKPMTLTEMAKSWPQNRKLIICAEWGDAEPIHLALSRWAGEGGAPRSGEGEGKSVAAILTGPEGGLAIDELATLKNIPNSVCVRLGPRILRADTAAIAALTCWQAIYGDWK